MCLTTVKNGKNEKGIMEIEPVNPAESIIELDKLFKKTVAKPPIYYLPLTPQQVELYNIA